MKDDTTVMSEQIDFAQLAEDITPEDLRTVARVFRTDVERLSASLSQAAADGNEALFRRVAHGLAGAAGAVGAKQLEQACRAAMAPGHSGLDPVESAARIAALAQSALAQLAAFVARLDPAGPQEQ